MSTFTESIVEHTAVNETLLPKLLISDLKVTAEITP